MAVAAPVPPGVPTEPPVPKPDPGPGPVHSMTKSK